VAAALQTVQHRLSDGETAELSAAPRVVYHLDDNRAEHSTGRRTLQGPLRALSFEVVPAPSGDALLSAPIDLDPGEQRLIRCDRVDFPPGGVAYLHTHQGPGIRVLLHGSIRIDTSGRSHHYGPLEAWFEPGPEPVFAAASESEPTAFVRCMVLPARLRGKSSISYVRAEDAEKPKPQTYTVFVDEPLNVTAGAR
jgi:quercetin dioxygenase-like cupin family protein